jgi:hypothetical protein
MNKINKIEHLIDDEKAELNAIACRLGQIKPDSNPHPSSLKTKLIAALKIAKPDIGKEYLYERCVNKYVDEMMQAISAAIANRQKDNQLLPDQFYFCQSKVREAIGTIGKKQHYIYQVMKDDSSTALLLVIHKGFSNNGVSRLSTCTINPIYKELVLEEILNLRIESNQHLLDEIESDANYSVSVSPQSLQSFITKTAETIRTTSNGDSYKDKLLSNLTAARQLQLMTHAADEDHPTPYLNERWEMADSGRIYGQGYSLQRMPKEVRHAALGVCHKYDFKACAFALMAGLAHAIDRTLLIGATLDYVKNRQKIRERVAKQLNISESLVKTIFTAMGFGAELKNNQHNAIRGALAKSARQQYDSNVRLERDVYNNLGADEFQLLIANPTFRFIYDELQTINATILAYFKTHDLQIGDNTYNAIDPKTGKRRTDKQKLAWIYQALEAQAMERFVDLAGQEPLLTTHDCIYFKQKLPVSQVLDITMQLQEQFPYLRFEHEAIYPIAGDAEYEARFAEADAFELAHKLHIEAETQRAQKLHDYL